MNKARNCLAGWTFSDAEIAAARSGKLLLNPSLDLGNPCNLNCAYCFVEEKNSTRKIRFSDEMTADETFSIINDFADNGAKSVNLVGAGEPTIDPLFPTVIERISARGMTAVVFTNGIFLGQRAKLVDMLYERGATVVLKFNSQNAEKQDAVAGRRGYSAARDAALNRLLDRGFSAHCPTRLALDVIVFRGVITELPDILRMCRNSNIFPIIADFIPTGRTDHGHFVGHAALQTLEPNLRRLAADLLEPPTPEERFEIFNDLARVDRDQFEVERTQPCAYYSGSPCTQILGVYVDNHGNIWPCVARSRVTAHGLQSALLGNVRKGDLPSTVWLTDPYLKALREQYTGACPYKSSLGNLA